jgi:hypothetical protein
MLAMLGVHGDDVQIIKAGRERAEVEWQGATSNSCVLSRGSWRQQLVLGSHTGREIGSRNPFTLTRAYAQYES